MKIVAVSQRVDFLKSRSESRDAIDQALTMFLLQAGMLPAPVPNNLSFSVENDRLLQQWLQLIKPHGIILSGGNNIGDNCERDKTEEHLLEYAESCGLPVLGICRGMQMMAAYSGVGCKKVYNHVNTIHDIYGELSGTVNSYHSYAIERCPPDFIITGISQDGHIEAIKHKDRRWEGWMWHPERESPFNINHVERLKGLFK